MFYLLFLEIFRQKRFLYVAGLILKPAIQFESLDKVFLRIPKYYDSAKLYINLKQHLKYLNIFTL